MAAFTVRVELHKADSDDYDKLHEKMEADGFSRTVASDDGATYHLPTAEYSYSHPTMTAREVASKAHAVANAVKPKPAVLVTKSAGRSWQGLEKV